MVFLIFRTEGRHVYHRLWQALSIPSSGQEFLERQLHCWWWVSWCWRSNYLYRDFMRHSLFFIQLYETFTPLPLMISWFCIMIETLVWLNREFQFVSSSRLANWTLLAEDATHNFTIYKVRRYMYIYLLPFYWHHGINFPLRKKRKRYITETFLTGPNAFIVITYILIVRCITTIYRKTGVPENRFPDTPETWNLFVSLTSISTWFLKHLSMAFLGFLRNFV